MKNMNDLPVIVDLPGANKEAASWSRHWDWGKDLDDKFPGQDGYSLASAVEHNDTGPTDELRITSLVMEKEGMNDGENWIWLIGFEDGSTWRATGGCDYTGWDCQSWLGWEKVSG